MTADRDTDISFVTSLKKIEGNGNFYQPTGSLVNDTFFFYNIFKINIVNINLYPQFKYMTFIYS